MKAVVIGLGSMGRRRIRLMQAMENAPEIVRSCFASIRAHCSRELVVLRKDRLKGRRKETAAILVDTEMTAAHKVFLDLIHQLQLDVEKR